VVSTTDPYSRILDFLDWSHYYFFLNCTHDAEWTPVYPPILKLKSCVTQIGEFCCTILESRLSARYLSKNTVIVFWKPFILSGYNTESGSPRKPDLQTQNPVLDSPVASSLTFFDVQEFVE
jgi:hypothetical protein